MQTHFKPSWRPTLYIIHPLSASCVNRMCILASAFCIIIRVLCLLALSAASGGISPLYPFLRLTYIVRTFYVTFIHKHGCECGFLRISVFPYRCVLSTTMDRANSDSGASRRLLYTRIHVHMHLSRKTASLSTALTLSSSLAADSSGWMRVWIYVQKCLLHLLFVCKHAIFFFVKERSIAVETGRQASGK